jgi:peptidoglycan/xylan/chitin deacetylase (PgdA/CDA1 family)
MVRRGRRLRSRLRGGAIILGYHRVASSDRDPFGLCVSAGNFAEHLEVLSRALRPIPLAALVGRLRNGARLDGIVVVTFDDGYVDNLEAAKPLLERWNVPATVHVVAGALGARFWWDELTALLPMDREVRRQHRFLMRLVGREREAALARVAPRIGIRGDGLRARTMTADELTILVQGGLVTLGSHSLTHESLPNLNREAQRAELLGSKEQLEGVIGHPIDGVAYPYGCAAPDTRHLARDAGYQWGCAGHEDTLDGGTDLYWLPRLWAPNVDGDAFARWLSGWIPGGVRGIT